MKALPKEISCGCGCGASFPEMDKYGRKRKFLPNHSRVIKDFKEYILNNITINSDGCWIWQKSKTKAGYGITAHHQQRVYVHRLSYKIFKGEITKPNVCHTCDNPSCVNPDHLFLGSQLENMHDCFKKNRIDATGLSNEEVTEIRRLKNEGQTQRTISKKFNVSQPYVCRIINNIRRSGHPYL